MSINIITLAGNLGDDPTVHYSGTTGEPVANFDLAFRCGKEKTGWIRCVCFRKLAEITENYLHKGARIAVVGSLDENTWTTDDDQKRKTMQVICNSIEFIKTDKRGFKEGQSEDDLPF